MKATHVSEYGSRYAVSDSFVWAFDGYVQGGEQWKLVAFSDHEKELFFIEHKLTPIEGGK